MRAAAGLAGAVAVAVLVAGCGGGGTKAFTAEKTKACLEKQGVAIVPVDEANDFVATSALAGSLGAKLALNRVTISFGRDTAEGVVIAQAYAKYGSANVAIDQVLSRHGNAVLLWAGAPTVQDSKVVVGCLKG